jgi:hypothetical protein
MIIIIVIVVVEEGIAVVLINDDTRSIGVIHLNDMKILEKFQNSETGRKSAWRGCEEVVTAETIILSQCFKAKDW